MVVFRPARPAFVVKREGERFRVKQDRGDWVLVPLKDGSRSGWIRKLDVEN